MSSKDIRKSTPTSVPDEAALRRKRFRIAKLEERIAPKKGGKGTNNCGGGGSSNDESSASAY
jgi:hypothetical protein